MTSPRPRGNCLPRRSEIFINFLLGTRWISIRPVTYAGPTIAQRKLLLEHDTFLPTVSCLSSFDICRVLRAETCPPCWSNGNGPLFFSVLLAIAITSRVFRHSPTKTTSRDRLMVDKSSSAEFDLKESKEESLVSPESAKKKGRFCRHGSVFSLPFFLLVRNVREITTRDDEPR